MEIKIGDTVKLINEDCLKALDQLPENSVDSIVTDPPYHLTSITERFGKENSTETPYGKDGSFQKLSKGFMGKEWDGGDIAFRKETWEKAYRVLKNGGYVLAFSHSRQFHRLAVAIEDAGFEIRDTIMWLYGSGFPKSHNIGLAIDKKNGVKGESLGISPNARPNSKKEDNLYEAGTVGKEFEIYKATNKWSGWGTALKPAYEPIIVARKPLIGTVVENIETYEVGGINIDECRIGTETREYGGTSGTSRTMKGGSFENGTKEGLTFTATGRFPANVIHDGSDEVVSGFPETTSGKMTPEHTRHTNGSPNGIYGKFDENHPLNETYGDSGSASRFFYTAKASQQDRDEGLDLAGFEEQRKSGYGYDLGLGNAGEGMFKDRDTQKRNTHPTVKPTDLMKYLVRLVTPKGGTVLDFFMGSGSTGKAVIFENAERQANYKFIGIDITKEYVEIAKARIEWAMKTALEGYEEITKDGKKVLDKPISLFDFNEGKE